MDSETVSFISGMGQRWTTNQLIDGSRDYFLKTFMRQNDPVIPAKPEYMVLLLSNRLLQTYDEKSKKGQVYWDILYISIYDQLGPCPVRRLIALL